MSESIVNFEDWTEWVLEPTYQMPALPTAAELEQLPSTERSAIQDLRRTHNSREVTVLNARFGAIEAHVLRRHLLNRNSGPKARHGFVVEGPTRTGKSTVLLTFGKRFEQDLRAQNPERFVDAGGARYTPVVYFSLPAAANEKTISKGLADYLNVPYLRSDNEYDITAKVLRALKETQTEMLLIDEIQNLGRHGDSPAGRRAGQIANDYMKNLCNKVSATPLFAGTDVKASGLFNEFHGDRVSQTSGRFTVLPTSPYRVDSKEALKEWRELILALEKPLHLYSHGRGDLVRLGGYLHDRSGGYISTLSQLIREASLLAIDLGEERIDQGVLDQVAVDNLSTEAFDELQRRAAKDTAKRAESAKRARPRAS